MKTRSAADPTPFRINPSGIARYFFHDCERFLRYSSTGAELRNKEHLPQREFDSSPLMQAILGSGYAWEEKVLTTRLVGRVAIAAGAGELHQRRFDWDDTIELLRTAKPGAYLYQPTLRAPQAFYTRYGLDPSLVAVSDNHPDLIEVLADGPKRRLLRVLDVKRGETLRLVHRVQILFYALELEDMLREQGVTDAAADLRQGAVWLGDQPEPTPFDLDDFRPHLETFLRHDLERILRLPVEDVPWHLYFRCEWCEFFEHCHAQMCSQDDVSRLIGITTYGKRHLREAAAVHTVPEFTRFLKSKTADEVLAQCASLAGQRPHFETQIAAHRDGAPRLHGAAAPAMPIGENIRLLLTVQQEPLGQSIYLAGVYLQAKDEIFTKALSQETQKRLLGPRGRPQPVVFVAAQPGDAATVRREWIGLLHNILTEVDQFNYGKSEWSEQLSLQAFVHSEQEKTLLVRFLIEALREPDLAEAAMTLLFHFQAPDLMLADQHPESEVPYPIVVLLYALGRLMALPVDVSYTLPESLAALGSKFDYRRNDYYHFPLGHGLRAEAIHAAWHRGKSDLIPEIRKHAQMYLYAVSSLLQAIRDQGRDMLFAWPPKFRLAAAEAIADPLLSRLAFFTKYENLLGCLAVRDARSDSRAVQTLLGQALELEAIDDVTMKVVGEPLMEVEESTFPAWLLVEDSEAGRRAQLEYRDYQNRGKPWGGAPHAHCAVVGIQHLEEDDLGFPTQLTFSYGRAFADRLPQNRERYLLYPRFTDYNSDRIVKFLQALDGQEGLFCSLLRDPAGAAAACLLPAAVEKQAATEEKKLSLTRSQRDAYRKIRQTRVAPVWGPPGTGKTHFLASIILGLSSAYARAGQPFRVLVTAFTHAAIENVLRKIDELRRTAGLGAQGLVLGKAKHWQSNTLAAADVVDDKRLPPWLARHEQAVLGATVYSCLKAYDKIEPFDLVVIDEASQVRAPEASIPISLVAEQGRLVLAGDHKQLPPIVTGEYPEPEPDEPLLHRSVFEAVCPREGEDPSRIAQLVENFRMNDVLTSLAADLLYGPAYRCFNDEIAARRLGLQLPRNGDAFVRACLDPAYPIAVVVLDGVRAAQENLIEAQLVSRLVLTLRERLHDADGDLYADDADFFREGVFIVSPHRAQIRTIQRELAAQRAWEHTPFVDTVDKMQGQEADAVIVSYGVADPEFAMQEAEFIYSLNRLNVSMTRAKTKCVIFLPRPLLDATPHILDEPNAARGLAFMRNLVLKVEDSGETLGFELNDGVRATVYRTQTGMS